MYQTYFWDFDGTLFDSYAVMAPALVFAFKKQGANVASKEAYRLMRQKSRGEAFAFFKQQYPQVDVDLAYRDYKQFEQEHADKLQPFPDAAKVCEEIIATGGRNFLLTHRNKEVWDLLAARGFKDYFSGGISGQDHFARKPSPDSLNYLCEKYQVSKKTAAMVGDRTLDIEAGHNAGMAGILFDPDDLITDCQPDLRVKTLAEIIAENK